MTFEFLIGRGVKEEKIRGDWRRGDEDDFQSRFNNLSMKKTFLLFRWTIMFQTRTTSISADLCLNELDWKKGDAILRQME